MHRLFLAFSAFPLALFATGVNTTPAGSAFASACAGTGTSGFNGAGYAATSGNGLICNSQMVGSSGQAFASAAGSGTINGHNWSGSADSQAALGLLRLKSSDSGSSATQFSGGEGNVGFNEEFTINGGVGNAVWVTKIHLDGSMSVSGLGALGRVELAVYKNGSVLQGYTPGTTAQAYNIFNSSNTKSNGTVGYSWDYQMVAFQVTDYGVGNNLTLNSLPVDRNIYFAIPFTYGTAFTVGYWMSGMSGQIASGGQVVDNSASLDFSHTAAWGGKGYVVGSNGNSSTAFGLTATSGVDYNNAFTPEPGSFGVTLVAVSAVVIGLCRRR